MKPRILVLAKSPAAGNVKTRLCPPCAPDQATKLAEAALADTLDAAVGVRGATTTLVLDGPAGPWLPDGVAVIHQRGSALDERIAAAFSDGGAPALIIGMDTPQVSPQLLSEALDALLSPGVDAVLGEALDGGWWAAGLRRADPRVFRGVPMSTPTTCLEQRARFRSLGLRLAGLPRLRDVDTIEDAIAVARGAPHTRFAAALDGLMRESEPAVGKGFR